MHDKTNAAGLVEVVRAAGGNLSEAARRLAIPRDTVVSRLRKHGLLPAVRRAREEHREAEASALRALLGELPPSDRVRILLAQTRTREVLLRELEARDDLDEDARNKLRQHRRDAFLEAAGEVEP